MIVYGFMGIRFIDGMRVKDNRIIEDVDPNIEDQPFLDVLRSTLLDTLFDRSSSLIKKYAGIYFTGDEKIDCQILSAISVLNNGVGNLENGLNNQETQKNDKMNKVLFILKKTIIKKFFLQGMSLCDNSKGHLKSILLTAVDKYSIEDLEMIFSFDNITFDILENLNGFDDTQRNGVMEVVNILKNDLGINYFFSYLTKNNISNIKENLLYLKESSPNILELIKDSHFDYCCIKNGKGSMVDLLLLENSGLKLLLKQLDPVDSNILSITYPGYKFYELLFNKFKAAKLNDNVKYLELLKVHNTNQGEYVIFRIEKGLPIEMLGAFHPKNITYDQCVYIYDNITKDPNQLSNLFGKKYDIVLFLYNNITKDANEILDLYYSIAFCEQKQIEYIKTIYDELDEDYSKFKRIIKSFDDLEITGEEFQIIAFLCKNFKDDIDNWLKDRTHSKADQLLSLHSRNAKNVIRSGRGQSPLWPIGDNIEFVYENGIFTTLDSIIENDDIVSRWDGESLKILYTLYTKKENYEERLHLFDKINWSNYSKDHKNKIIHKIGKLPISKAEKYIQIGELLDKSNSFDIQIVKDNLILDILNSDDPENIAKKIDAVFLESNVPYISKIFQIFKYIYTEDNFNKKLESHGSPSHYLQSGKTYDKRLEIIYKDLMNIIIKSNESSLRQYINEIISCKEALYDFENGKIIDDEGCRQILSLMKKIQSLSVIINGHGVKNMDILDDISEIDYVTLREYCDDLKKFLLLKGNDSIYAFFLNLCKKIGYKSLEDILIDMDKSQMKANDNGLAKYNSIQQGEIFNHGDNYFLKGIDPESLGEILNRGVTSTEYLGGGEGASTKASSNGTPFDTDGVVVNGENLFEIAKGHGYGDLDIIVNISKPWIYNTDTGLEGYRQDLYEIFKNHGEESNYYGIRTGIASTEFDAIVYESEDKNSETLQGIKYLIAKNGFYLPVLDLKGNLLFTPEEYHNLRQVFSFSDKHKGYDVEEKDGNYVSSEQCDTINKGDEEFSEFVKNQMDGENTNIDIDNEAMAKLVFDKIKNILESELGIKCNQNKELLGAELYDSGSTGRGTEIPSNDIDLDFTLLLSSKDYERLDEIQKVIHEKIGTKESTDHSTVEGNLLQIKSSVNNLGKEYGYENGIRFDLLVMKKTKSYLYPSNVAMQDRLAKVEETYGNDTLDFVKENIVIMKKLLKSQGVYKNTEGGIGGIGVENRIMQHHGNFIEALESFENIAFGGKYTEGKENISFEEFKNIYTIRDSGQNFKDGKNDNYALKMNKTGYNGTLNIIKKYRTQGLDGISQLIQEYEQKKAEFIK